MSATKSPKSILTFQNSSCIFEDLAGCSYTHRYKVAVGCKPINMKWLGNKDLEYQMWWVMEWRVSSTDMKHDHDQLAKGSIWRFNHKVKHIAVRNLSSMRSAFLALPQPFGNSWSTASTRDTTALAVDEIAAQSSPKPLNNKQTWNTCGKTNQTQKSKELLLGKCQAAWSLPSPKWLFCTLWIYHTGSHALDVFAPLDVNLALNSRLGKESIVDQLQ